jgi:hypothetical protein
LPEASGAAESRKRNLPANDANAMLARCGRRTPWQGVDARLAAPEDLQSLAALASDSVTSKSLQFLGTGNELNVGREAALVGGWFLRRTRAAGQNYLELRQDLWRDAGIASLPMMR